MYHQDWDGEDGWFIAVILAAALVIGVIATLSGCAAPRYSTVPGPSPSGTLATNLTAVPTP